MAHLPPRSPNYVGTNFGGFEWLKDFVDPSSARRGTHRLSASDSGALLEDMAVNNDHEFDDDGFVCVAPSSVIMSNTCTLSGHNGTNEEKEAEVRSEPKVEAQMVEDKEVAEDAVRPGSADAPDPKRVKRILANRQSAQRSRVRRLQYISALERSVAALQTEVLELSPQVAFFQRQRSVLTVGNSNLRQRIAAFEQDKFFKDAHQEDLKKEIERLRQLYKQQSLLTTYAGPGSDHSAMCADKEILS